MTNIKYKIYLGGKLVAVLGICYSKALFKVFLMDCFYHCCRCRAHNFPDAGQHYLILRSFLLILLSSFIQGYGNLTL